MSLGCCGEQDLHRREDSGLYTEFLVKSQAPVRAPSLQRAQLAALWPELTAFGRHLPASAAFNKNKITRAGGFLFRGSLAF